MHYMFQAGCAGDLKEGSLGDFQLAQERESLGVLIAWAAMACGVAEILLRRTLNSVQRFGVALLFFVFALIALTVAGIQFEVWGVQACF